MGEEGLCHVLALSSSAVAGRGTSRGQEDKMNGPTCRWKSQRRLWEGGGGEGGAVRDG